MADRPRLTTPFDEAPQAEAVQPVERHRPKPRFPWRFGIGSLMGLTLLVAIAASSYSGVVRGGDLHAYYVVLAMLAPFLVLGGALLAQQFKRKPAKQRSSEQDPWDEHP